MNSLVVVNIFILIGVISFACATTSYRMCVPHHIMDACREVASKSTRDVRFECVAGRDRMECLELVQKRLADIVATDPEDMYVAFSRKNEDFSIFTELRTVEESNAEFRYEGIILTRKNNGIEKLSDLRGKKSCHTGFNRNVGYLIPITRLKKNGLLKISPDPMLSTVEKQLKALSEFFTKACIVGNYSPDQEVNHNLKLKYPNLCAMCEDPVKCNYPDKFSGYDGAIKCLVENGGDIAFTKVAYVRKFFGLSNGNNPVATEAEANPDDYEYLCEDGTRRPVTGRACSWAARPWQGFMSNADANTNVAQLQSGLKNWYDDGLSGVDQSVASKLWIGDKHTLVDKKFIIYPGSHLDEASYREVIEGDGSVSQKIRLCVTTDVEMRKCDVLKWAAFTRNIRPEFDCMESRDCLQTIHEGNADAAVVYPVDFARAHGLQLKKIMKEVIDPESVYVVVADRNTNSDVVKKTTFKFDKTDSRACDVAVAFNRARNIETDVNTIQSATNSPIEIVHSSHLTEEKFLDKELICPDFSVKPLSEAKTCNFDGLYTRGVFVRNDLSATELDGIVHGFKSLSNKFGHGNQLEDVFEMFGEFEVGSKNVIFTDDAKALENDDDVNVLSKTK